MYSKAALRRTFLAVTYCPLWDIRLIQNASGRRFPQGFPAKREHWTVAQLKPNSISSFFAAKLSTIAKKQKPQVIVIDVDEGPDEAVIVADNAGTEKENRLVDVVCVIDSEGLLVSFLVVANPDDVT